MKSKWTWMISKLDAVTADCEHMEAEGWTVVSIVSTNPNFDYFRVFMRRETHPSGVYL